MKRNYELFPGRNDDGLIRRFFVSPSGEAIEHVGSEAIVRAMGVSPALSAAIDIFYDAGIVDPQIVSLAVHAERRGQNPEHFARHFVKLRKAVRRG